MGGASGGKIISPFLAARQTKPVIRVSVHRLRQPQIQKKSPVLSHKPRELAGSPVCRLRVSTRLKPPFAACSHLKTDIVEQGAVQTYCVNNNVSESAARWRVAVVGSARNPRTMSPRLWKVPGASCARPSTGRPVLSLPPSIQPYPVPCCKSLTLHSVPAAAVTPHGGR